MIFWVLSKTTSISASLRGREDSNSMGLTIGDISGVGGSSFSESVSGVCIGSCSKNIVFPSTFSITQVIICLKIMHVPDLTSSMTGLGPGVSDISVSF